MSVNGPDAFNWKLSALERYSLQSPALLFLHHDSNDDEKMSAVQVYSDAPEAQALITDWITRLKFPEGINIGFAGNIHTDAATVFNSATEIQCFDAMDFFGVLRQCWPASQQRMFAWRRKTKEMAGALKSSKLAWKTNLSSLVEHTPQLAQSSVLTDEQYHALDNMCRMDCILDDTPPLDGRREYPQKLSTLAVHFSQAVLDVHNLIALFNRVQSKLPVHVHRGHRGPHSGKVEPYVIPGFMYPIKRDTSYDWVFAAE